MVAELRNHVLQFSDWFNEAAAKQRLGITLDPAAVVRHIENTLPDHITKLYGQMTEHMVHKEQVQTAIDAIASTIAEPGKSGIVLGALQSGKTGTAFMTLFAAPIHYLKSRVTFVPLFMTTNQNSHLMQTQKAMRGFFDLYGGINIVSDGKTHSLIDYYQQSGADLVETPEGENEITLRGYHTRLGEDMYPGSDPVEALVKGMTVKRVPGGISKKVRSYCERARDRGHGVMLIVDEPQYGASNQIKKNGDEVECLLSRLFAEVDEDFFSPDTPNFMIGLSATPFDTAYMTNLWRVNQRLSKSYVGPNVFGGMRIDDSVITKVPKVASFKDVARMKGLDWFGEIPYLIGASKKPERSTFRATTVGEDGERRELKLFERKQKGADLVRALFDSHLIKRQASSGEPIGALLRIANSTKLTKEILEAMDIDGPNSPYNVIRFYGANGDIKQLIWEATRKDKRPYIVVTVGKGRMGDAFPASTVMAVDLTNSPTDANAFLQGVYGRMCGYGKRDPVVFVSDKSKELHAQYMENLGATPEFDLSKHVKTTVLSKGRNHRESYFMITDEMIDSDHEDSPLRAFRADIIAYLERQELSKDTLNQNVPKRENQYMNLPALMARHGLINYVAENSRRLDPELQDPARIVPIDGISTHIRRDGSTLPIGYNKLGDDVKVLISKVAYNSVDTTYEAGVSHSRRSSQGLSSGGRRDPAKHVNRGRRNDSIMPVITVKKVDANGATVALHEKGRYVFDGMVFHLEEKVRRYSPTVNRIALVRGHAFAPALTNNEKAIRVGMYVSGHMYGQKAYSFMESLGMADVQRVLDDVYDRDTHTYEVVDQTLIFRDLATGQVGNTRGPATIDMSDPKNVITHDVVRESAGNRTGYVALNDDEGLDDEIELANLPRQAYRQSFGM